MTGSRSEGGHTHLVRGSGGGPGVGSGDTTPDPVSAGVSRGRVGGRTSYDPPLAGACRSSAVARSSKLVCAARLETTRGPQFGVARRVRHVHVTSQLTPGPGRVPQQRRAHHTPQTRRVGPGRDAAIVVLPACYTRSHDMPFLLCSDGVTLPSTPDEEPRAWAT